MANNSYTNYKNTFDQIYRSLISNNIPKLIVFFGDSDALILNGIKKIKQRWKQKEKNFHVYHKSIYSYEDLLLIWEHQALFEQSSMHCLYNIEKQKNFYQLLNKTPSTKNILNPTLLIIKTSTNLNNTLKKSLTRLQANFIPCFSPKKFEFPALIKDMCDDYHILLTPSASKLIQEYIGTDLTNLNNELNKLAFIFHGTKKILSEKDISQYIGCLREDHIFSLHNYILEENLTEASLLLLDLLQKGYPALILLATLNKFCCNALQIAENQITKLPPFVINKYKQYINKKNRHSLKKALLECHHADILLKTNSKIKHELVLEGILSYL